MAASNTSPTANFPITCKDFNSKAALDTQVLLDYYKGEQLKYLEDMLDGKRKGYGKRVEWRKRGIMPVVRNIVKSIVDKSGLLFNAPPTLAIKANGSVEATTDEILNSILEGADWLEFFQNVDAEVRLLKSVVVLQQKWIPNGAVTVNGQYKFNAGNGDGLLLQLLNQGNSVVLMDPMRTKITALAYITSPQQYDNLQCDDTDWTYQLITPKEIIDVLVKIGKGYDQGQDDEEVIIDRQTNPEGFVPACFFYDTNKPRGGVWAHPPEDIRTLQDMYNLAYADDIFAVAWQKQKTAFITGKIINNDLNLAAPTVPAAHSGKNAPGSTWDNVPAFQQNATHLGGLGSVVRLGETGNGDPGKVEFLGPDTDLMIPFTVIKSHAENIASDWDVSLAIAGTGSATSGFQLVVEEMDNLNNRQKRSQSMVAGFRRFYEILKQLYVGQVPDGILQIEFGPPNLPVNEAEREQIWAVKIAGNRASQVDYFMEVDGMTEEEATAKHKKVIAVNNMVAATATPPPPTAQAAEQTAEKPIKPMHVDSQNG